MGQTSLDTTKSYPLYLEAARYLKASDSEFLLAASNGQSPVSRILSDLESKKIITARQTGEIIALVGTAIKFKTTDRTPNFPVGKIELIIDHRSTAEASIIEKASRSADASVTPEQERKRTSELMHKLNPKVREKIIEIFTRHIDAVLAKEFTSSL